MKKNIAIAVMTSTLLATTLISGCSASSSTVQNTETATESTAAEASGQTKDDEAEAETEPESQTIEIGQTVTVGDYELTVTGFEWCTEFEEKCGNGTIRTIAEDAGGDTLLRVTATIKNSSACKYSTNIGIKTSLKVNDKYNVDGESKSDSIGPLSTGDVSFSYPMSNELKDAFETSTITFEVHGVTDEKPTKALGTMIDVNGSELYSTQDVLGTYTLEIAQ